MSIQAMVWAMRQTIVTAPTSRHVLLCLANYAGEDGRGAFPSVATLSRQTGLSERSVQNHLRKLEELGAITRGDDRIAASYIWRGDRRPTVWSLSVSQEHPATSRDIPRGAAPAPRERGADDDIKPDNGVQITTERGAAPAPDTSYNLKQEQELAGAVPLQPVQPFICLTLIGGEMYPVHYDQIIEYEGLFPTVDVRQALRSMAAWTKANVKKRKTKRGTAAFITAWLTTELKYEGRKNETTDRSAVGRVAKNIRRYGDFEWGERSGGRSS